jgi:hypothetical protein
MSFEPESFRPLSEAPIGQDLKCSDALEAIEFARSYCGEPFTTLKKDAITPFLQVFIDRILD